MKKRLRILLVVIGLVALPSCSNNSKINTATASAMAEIYNDYVDGQFSAALQRSASLPEPYAQTYQSYINMRAGLDDWEGTESQLFDWMDNFFNRFDFEAMELPQEVQQYCIWTNGPDAKEAFQQNREWIADALPWAGEVKAQEWAFYKKSVSLVEENQALVLVPASAEQVQLYPADINRIDAEMQSLYDGVISAMDQLTVQYSVSAQGTERIIRPFLAKANTFVTEVYFENISLSRLCEAGGSGDSLILGREEADAAYKAIGEQLSLLMEDEDVASAVAGMQSDQDVKPETSTDTRVDYATAVLEANKSLPTEGDEGCIEPTEIPSPDSASSNTSSMLISQATVPGRALVNILYELFPDSTLKLKFYSDMY